MSPARLFLLVSCGLAIAACSTTGNLERYDQQVAQGNALAVPHVRQASPTDCGMAALASVMEYYKGPPYSQQALRESDSPASPGGYTLGELRAIARAHDFAGFVVPGEQAFLRSQLSRGRPLIVPLQVQGADPPVPGVAALSTRLVEPLVNRAFDTSYDHYVVVVGFDDERRKVITMDPARGPVELDFDDFAAGWEKMNRAVLLVGLASAPH